MSAPALEASGAALAVIVPAFNEARGLADVLPRLLAARGDRPWEIIVVDDASTDDTARVAADHAAAGVRLIRQSANRGYGAALKAGILATRAENVLFIDADGQHLPEEIPALVAALATHECVFTARPRGAGIPWARRPGKWLLHRICCFLANRRIPDINSGFRAGRRHIYMMMLDLLPDGFSFSTTSLMYVMRSRFSHIFLPIQCRTRVGSSSVRIVSDGLKTLLLALRLIMLFDPLRAFGLPAVALVTAGLLYQIYIFLTFRLTIVGGAVLSILAGVILFHVGLLADQIASLRKEISSHNCLLWEDRERRGRDS